MTCPDCAYLRQCLCYGGSTGWYCALDIDAKITTLQQVWKRDCVRDDERRKHLAEQLADGGDERTAELERRARIAEEALRLTTVDEKLRCDCGNVWVCDIDNTSCNLCAAAWAYALAEAELVRRKGFCIPVEGSDDAV